MTDIVARVEKLIALTASSNENEARNAAALACKLIREHKLRLTGGAVSDAGSRPASGGGVGYTGYATSFRVNLEDILWDMQRQQEEMWARAAAKANESRRAEDARRERERRKWRMWRSVKVEFSSGGVIPPKSQECDECGARVLDFWYDEKTPVTCLCGPCYEANISGPASRNPR